MVSFNDLPNFVFVVVLVSLAAGIGAIILQKTKTEVMTSGNATTNPNGYVVNTTLDDGTTAMSDITSWLGVVVIVMMGGIIIKLLVDAFQ